jgi:hypothetical protein
MLLHFKTQFPALISYWDKYLEFQQRLEVPAKAILLEEGKISQQYIFIEKGAVRAFFNNNGIDKTVQFFFENEGLTSIESFINSALSQFAIETIESSTVYLLPKKYVIQLMVNWIRPGRLVKTAGGTAIHGNIARNVSIGGRRKT